MSVEPMQINLPHLVRSRMASGRWRYRVRLPNGKFVTVRGEPGTPEFLDNYQAALHSDSPQPPPAPRGSIAWLVGAYLAQCRREVTGGTLSPLTLKQRESLLHRLVADHGQTDKGPRTAALDKSAVERLLAARAATPGAARNLLKALRSMFKWAVKLGHVRADPTLGVERARMRSDGFAPWSVADLRRFMARHPPGTKAHLALMILVFTGARRSDLMQLGRQHMVTIDGEPWLAWHQAKGGTLVEVPILPPLARALATPVVGDMVFLLTDHGKPFGHAGLGYRFHAWCEQAGIEGRSMHGVRKAAGALLAECGVTEEEIMAVLGHSNPRTAAIYTRSANRRTLAKSAMAKMKRVQI